MNQRATSFYDVEDVASTLDLSSKTVRRLIASGELKAHRFGRLIRISQDDLRAYIALQRQ